MDAPDLADTLTEHFFDPPWWCTLLGITAGAAISVPASFVLVPPALVVALGSFAIDIAAWAAASALWRHFDLERS